MCEQTLQDSVADTYADSPTYEQAYWLGDSQVSAAVDAYLYGDYSFTGTIWFSVQRAPTPRRSAMR